MTDGRLCMTMLDGSLSHEEVSRAYDDLQVKARKRDSLDDPNWALFRGLVFLYRTFDDMNEGLLWSAAQFHRWGPVAFAFRCPGAWVLNGWDHTAKEMGDG